MENSYKEKNIEVKETACPDVIGDKSWQNIYVITIKKSYYLEFKIGMTKKPKTVSNDKKEVLNFDCWIVILVS